MRNTGKAADVISFDTAMSASVRGQGVGANNDAASQVCGYGRVITAKHPLQQMSEASMMADVIRSRASSATQDFTTLA